MTAALPPNVRDGHRGLLATFREFIELREPHATTEVAALRACVAFLRQTLLPFSRWEEEQWSGCEEVAEDTAFEHAFLAAETDALAAAVDELERAEPGCGVLPLQRIRRHVHRIEAVLELHVQKAEDRDALFPHAAADDTERERPTSTRAMEQGELHRFLQTHRWGTLCTTGPTHPYAVPVSYGFDGRHFFLASGPGRKRDHLEGNPAVCLTIADAKDGERWCSVVVSGTASRVKDARGIFHALSSIRKQRNDPGLPSKADLARLGRAHVYRIAPDEISGRVRD